MIYFIQNESTKAIKIGYSVDVQKRLSQLQTAAPDRLVLIGQIPGDISDERALHDRFREHHLRGEWFRGDAGLPAELRAMSDSRRIERGHEYWSSNPGQVSALEAIASIATGFTCELSNFADEKDGVLGGNWCCYTRDDDPSFAEFLMENPGHKYWSRDCRSPVDAVQALIDLVFIPWRDNHKPGPTRVFCDTDGADWRRPRLQQMLDHAKSWSTPFLDSYIRQVTDTGSKLLVYWRFSPTQKIIPAVIEAWRSVCGIRTNVEAFDSIEHHLDGITICFEGLRESCAQWDLNEASQHLRVVG